MSVKQRNLEIPVITEYEGPYKTSGEYVDALRLWMTQVYHLQCISASFPYFLAASFQAAPVTVNAAPGRTEPAVQQPQPQVERGREYVVPSLWKRCIAETIDFLILFTIKLAVTYFAVDYFDLFDGEQYNLETLRADMLSDYRFAMSMTSDLLLLEMIHRVGNCIFESLCLHRGSRGAGGATPGKKVMGLRVVRCKWHVPIPNGKVLVFPASDLGLGRAFIRAVAKNITITLLFPLCVTMFLYQHNRTMYDVMSGAIVVEDPLVTRRNLVNNNNNNNNNINQ